MCARACVILDMLGKTDAWIAEQLEYTSQSTIGSIRRGKAFFDTERLAKLGRLPLARRAHPNLHWLLTGEGRPVLGRADADVAEVEALSTLAAKRAQAQETRGT
jgi:hypothetical protein